MDENTGILLVLKLLALCYPVLQSWGFSIEIPIVVILQNGSFTDCVRQFAIFQECVITSLDAKGRLYECMRKVFSEPILVHYDNTFKAQTMIQRLDTIVKAGYIGSKKALGLPIIVAEDMIPKDVLSDAFYIYYDASIESDLSYNLIKPDVFNLPVIKQIMETRASALYGNQKALVAAACFAYSQCKNDSDVEYLVNIVDSLTEKNNQMTDFAGIAEIFISGLYDWRAKIRQGDVLCELPNVPHSIENELDKYIFYDSRFVYLSNNLFQEIVAPFKNLWGINTLKKALSEDGLLVCGTGKTYMSKMNIWSERGIPKRYDMLRLDLERLDRPGEADFLTIFEGGF